MYRKKPGSSKYGDVSPEEYRKNRYHILKDSHCCVICTEPLPEGFKWVRCDRCRLRHVGSSMIRYDSRKATNSCVKCGVELDDGYTKIKCQTCLELDIITKTKLRETRVISKICRDCGVEDSIQGQVMCWLCYVKTLSNSHLNSRTLYQLLLDKWEEQGGRCAYTGIELTPGVNTSIDHILPKSLYPELKYTPSNLQWVHLIVNDMKGNRMPDDFVELCRQVVAYHDR